MVEKHRDDTHEMTRQERLAESAAYTLNHAIACSTWDNIAGGPVVAQWLQHNFGKFSKYLACTHGHTKLDWFLAEGAGDFLAVPITVLTENYTPWVTKGLQKVIEPLAQPFFYRGVYNATLHWAAHNGVPIYSKEFKQHLNETYKHEVEHLPHAALWTAYSTAYTVLLLKGGHYFSGKTKAKPKHDHDHSTEHKHSHGEKNHDHSHDHGHDHHDHHDHHHSIFEHGNDPWSTMILASLGGKTVSSIPIFTARGTFPIQAGQMDNWMGEHVFLPVTKAVGGVFGIDPDVAQRVHEHEKTRHEQPKAVINRFSAESQALQKLHEAVRQATQSI
jgi:hypothetical protein